MFAVLFCTAMLELMGFFKSHVFFLHVCMGIYFVFVYVWVVAHAWCMCRSQSIICRNPHPHCSPQWILGTELMSLGLAVPLPTILPCYCKIQWRRQLTEQFIIVGLQLQRERAWSHGGEPMVAWWHCTGTVAKSFCLDSEPLGWEKVERVECGSMHTNLLKP